MYEVFEHTADIGLRIAAPGLGPLLADAGRGLFSIIAGDLDQIRETESTEIAVAGSDRTYLLFDWLTEILYLFESQRLLLRRFEVRPNAAGIAATAFGERFDPGRHHLQHEVKAVTYHQLAVHDGPNGLEATVILDI